MGAPCSWQHSGLDLNNQEHKPDSQSADSTQGLLEAIYLSTPWFSVARGHSEPCEHRCFVCEPPVASLADGLDYRPRANPYHPYDRRLKNPHRKRMPAAQFESDPSKLQERCSRDGGDPDAINLISRIFSEGVTLSALTRQKTAEEVTSQAFGRGPGQVYLVLLETIQTGDSNIGFRYRCRLCPDYAKAASWKHERDVLRHLRKHHFGLAKECKQWCVKPHIRIPRYLIVLLGLVGSGFTRLAR